MTEQSHAPLGSVYAGTLSFPTGAGDGPEPGDVGGLAEPVMAAEAHLVAGHDGWDGPAAFSVGSPVQVIATYITQAVTAGVGNYASTLTITATGSITPLTHGNYRATALTLGTGDAAYKVSVAAAVPNCTAFSPP